MPAAAFSMLSTLEIVGVVDAGEMDALVAALDRQVLVEQHADAHRLEPGTRRTVS